MAFARAWVCWATLILFTVYLPSTLLNYQAPKGMVRKIDEKPLALCAGGGQIPVVCLSVCNATPPNCLDQSTPNFQGIFRGSLAVHISKISTNR